MPRDWWFGFISYKTTTIAIIIETRLWNNHINNSNNVVYNRNNDNDKNNNKNNNKNNDKKNDKNKIK